MTIFKEAFNSWKKNRPTLTAAGLSYFALFSLIPTLLIALAVAGKVFEAMSAQSMLLEQVSDLFSPDVAASLQSLLSAAEEASFKATFLSIGFLLWASSRMFMQIQDALNVIWETASSKGAKRWMAHRSRAIFMVAVLAFVIVIFLGLDIGFSMIKRDLLLSTPAVLIRFVIPTITLFLSLGLFTVLFASIFKILPHKRILWRDAWVGGFVSSSLFAAGRSVIAFYFSHSPIVSLYGAAGSILILLVWIYFSMHIFLFGAEFTRAYSHHKSNLREQWINGEI